MENRWESPKYRKVAVADVRPLEPFQSCKYLRNVWRNLSIKPPPPLARTSSHCIKHDSATPNPEATFNPVEFSSVIYFLRLRCVKMNFFNLIKSFGVREIIHSK